jgi:hypothetical protein
MFCRGSGKPSRYCNYLNRRGAMVIFLFRINTLRRLYIMLTTSQINRYPPQLQQNVNL